MDRIHKFLLVDVDSTPQMMQRDFIFVDSKLCLLEERRVDNGSMILRDNKLF